MRRRLSLPLSAAARTEASFFARKGGDFFFFATATFESEETVCQDPTPEECFEFFFDIIWNWPALSLTISYESAEVVLQDPIADR